MNLVAKLTFRRSVFASFDALESIGDLEVVDMAED